MNDDATVTVDKTFLLTAFNDTNISVYSLSKTFHSLFSSQIKVQEDMYCRLKANIGDLRDAFFGRSLPTQRLIILVFTYLSGRSGNFSKSSARIRRRGTSQEGCAPRK